jgi:YYY domain-containing protein
MNTSSETIQKNNISKKKRNQFIQYLVLDLILAGILIAGAYFRFTGINWDNNQHLHPDERFLTMVVSSIEPVHSISEYFDTANSSLNPNNRGYGFYVYGTLPLFIVRAAGEVLKQTGYDEIFLVGRVLSGLFDLMTVLMVYLIALRLYKNPRLGLLAAVLTAGSVMQIQLSHYFAVDSFATFFTTGAVYFAIRILTEKVKPPIPAWIGLESEEESEKKTGFPPRELIRLLRGWEGVGNILLFGFFVGCAMASKINTGLVALLLPAAYLVKYISLSVEERESVIGYFIRNTVIAAFVSFLIFRVFQPYAFSGPGFLGVIPSDKWIQTMRELSSQSTGDVDFPPALQWARRPIWFAPENMILFGMGIPFGLAAFAGFLMMGWRILTANWKRHILIWGWTGVFFTWQAVNWVRAMRYQVIIYPMFAIIAAWGIFAIWEKGKQTHRPNWGRLLKVFGFAAGTVVVVGTLLYAYAFSRIYSRTMTRVAASEWIYQNVPSAINLRIDTGKGVTNQRLAFRAIRTITSEDPLDISFKATSSGMLATIQLSHLVDSTYTPQIKTIRAQVSDGKGTILTTGQLRGDFPAGSDPRGDPFSILLDMPMMMKSGEQYYLSLTVIEPGLNLQAVGPVTLGLMTDNGASQILLPDVVDPITENRPYSIQLNAIETGKLTEIYFPRVSNLSASSGRMTFTATLSKTPGGEEILGKSDVSVDFNSTVSGLQEIAAKFNPPIDLEAKKPYTLILTTTGKTELALAGTKPALESSWDDPLPLGMNGINPFDYNSGPYRTDLNFEMYWDDSQDKLTKFLSTIQQADYIFITSNRQWGTTTRVPERYPLTSEYYRNLIGCPVGTDILWCFRVGQPGMYKGNLGFDLIQVFENDPTLGNFRINTQFAEEAFTVYDHPKVFIFKKRTDFDFEKVRQILTSVDLSKVVHLTPHKAGSYPGSLLLPLDRLISQQAGGTWIELFNPQAIQNQYPAVAAVLWYLVITLLGWLVYPILRIATKGLSDRGFGISKIVGMALLAYFAWLAGSAGISYSRLNILFVLVFLVFINIIAWWFQKDEISSDLKEKGRLFGIIEITALFLFLAFLSIRLGNPDLWHPYKGGEKPMDFSYFNAVLKSTSFPPYDPWFAGGYINYYYYGFVFVGTPVKLLGITPSVAYNLILPTLFSFLGTAAFSVGYSLIDSLYFIEKDGFISAIKRKILNTRMASEDPGVVLPSDIEDDEYISDRVESVELLKDIQKTEKATEKPVSTINPIAIVAGIASTLLLLILGNLGTIRMIWHGFVRLGSPTGTLENSGYLDRFLWTFKGISEMIGGAAFPYPPGDWYWIPSRAIPGEAITEFPFFTFLYADMHAHMIALPLTLAVIAWTLAMILRGWVWKKEEDRIPAWLQFGISLFLGGLLIGALRPTNTWDLPTYLAIGCIGLIATGFVKNNQIPLFKSNLKDWQQRFVEVGVAITGLVFFAFILYQPFAAWFGQGYNSIDIWEGTRTPSWSYFTHWGLFLILILSWFIQETYDWMATTPVSSLNRLKPYKPLIGIFALAIVLVPLGLVLYGVGIAWMAFPMAAWAGILMLRKSQPAAKRFVLFLVGTAFVLTLVVELIVLVGDIGRMNTVFKFYLQAWTLLAISSAFAFILVIPRRIEWPNWLNTGWQIVVSALIFCAALFPLLASTDKIRDRISPIAPHTLDGAAYMPSSVYNDGGVDINLGEDYDAIQWMLLNVKGSPVIVEANTVEYRWGSRFTIYTGLPSVVGWNWHQRQQRSVVPTEEVTNRVEEIKEFYLTPDRDKAREFLQKYNVKYIIVGQLENLYYPGFGLDKFPTLDGDLWSEVYQKGNTTIYKVILKG